MSSLNKVLLIGRLGRDPEKRYMPSGDPVVNFSIATSENWKDKSGQKQERTEWHNITIFGKLGEIAATYLKKGQQVYLEGRISSRKYLGKDNIERTTYDIICDQMVMLGSKNDSTVSFNAPPPIGSSIPPSQYTGEQNTPRAPVKREIEEKNVQIDELESDIPF